MGMNDIQSNTLPPLLDIISFDTLRDRRNEIEMRWEYEDVESSKVHMRSWMTISLPQMINWRDLKYPLEQNRPLGWVYREHVEGDENWVFSPAREGGELRWLKV